MKRKPLCRLCRRPEADLRYLDIYTFGSEGINVCNACLCAISDFCRMISRASHEAHKQGYKSALALAKEKV